MSSLSLILAALLCVIAIAASREGVMVAPIIGVVWLTFGVGHGLFDAILAARSWNLSLRAAFVWYATFAVSAGILAFVFPYPALALHTVLSAFHFGQSEWGERGRKTKISQGAVLLWGLSLITMMIMGPWKESRLVLESILKGDSIGLALYLGKIRTVLLVGFGITGLLASSWLGGRLPTLDNHRTQRILETLLLYVLFLTLPLWLSFTLYLSLWHGLRSLEEVIIPEIRLAWNNRSGRPALVLAVLAAALSIALIGYFGRQLMLPANREYVFVGTAAFAFLIAVTFPHVVVMACLSDKKSRARTDGQINYYSFLK